MREYALELSIFDLNGRKIKNITNGQYTPGYYLFEWEGMNESGQKVPAGIYIYRMSFEDSPDGIQQKKLILK